MKSEPAPPELINALSGETAEFTVKAKRSTSYRGSIGLLVFSLIWLSFTLLILSVFIGPVLMGNTVNFEANGVPTSAGPGNLKPLIVPVIFEGVFVLVGLFMLYGALHSMFGTGAWYAGTATRLIMVTKKEVRSIDWEQFSGDIRMSGTSENGSLILGMRTGEMVSQKNGPDRYVPGEIAMIGIKNTPAIEQIARKHIKANDPTPVGAPR